MPRKRTDDSKSGAPASASAINDDGSVGASGKNGPDASAHTKVDVPSLNTPLTDPNDESHQFAEPNHAVAERYRRDRMPGDMLQHDASGKFLNSKFISDAEMATKYGDGLSFWFVILKVYGVFFGVLTLLFLYFFASTDIANTENGTSTAELSTFARASLGAILYRAHERSRGGVISEEDKDQALAIVFIDAIAALCVLAITFYLYHRKERERLRNDGKTIDLTDYSEQVDGLPPDVTEDEVRDHFKRFGSIHAVVLARDVFELIKLREKELSTKPGEESKRVKLREAMEVASPMKPALTEAEMKADDTSDINLSKRTSWKYDKPPSRVVVAFVTFAEEQGRFNCDVAVVKSIANEKDKKEDRKNPLSDDVQNFTTVSGETVRLKIYPASPPSDLIWANFGFDKNTKWIRSVFVNFLMLGFLLLQFTGVAYATRGVESSINPIPQCSALSELSLDGTFACPSVWDFDNDPERAMKDMTPFIKQSISHRECSEYVASNGELDTDAMAPYLWFANDNSTAYPTVAATNAFRQQMETETSYSGGFLPNSIVDECAAHLCYACACDSSFDSTKQRGGDERRFDGKGGGGRGGGDGGGGRKVLARHKTRSLLQGDGPGDGNGDGGDGGDGGGEGGDNNNNSSFDSDSFCDEYDSDATWSDVYAVMMVVFTVLMNIVLKGISKALSEAEKPHTFTELEKSITRKLSASLLINMVFLPVALTADISNLSGIPLLFDGEHIDTDKSWYQGYCNKFSQVALTNAIVFPITAVMPVLKWWFGRLIKSKIVKTQYALNQAYAPPQYELSHRAAIFSGVLMYSILFSSAVPLVYPYLMALCFGFLVMDRLVLSKFCATPPRYSGRICAFVLHSVPLAILAHFALAVYIFGERDFPSYVYGDGESGKWADYGTTETVDSQGDINARLLRVNGIVPLLFFVFVASAMIAFYARLARKKLSERKGGIEVKPLEGAPPVVEALANGLVQGLPSYAIYDHPEYRELFPKEHKISAGM